MEGGEAVRLTSSRAWPLFIAWGACLSMQRPRWCGNGAGWKVVRRREVGAAAASVLASAVVSVTIGIDCVTRGEDRR